MGDPVHDAAWFPDGFDARSGEFLFVKAEREQLSSQTFLDRRWDRTGFARARGSARTLLAPSSLPSPNIIWHTGFCCSTLLAKTLDRPGCNLSLCEPQILVDVADAKRSGTVPPDSLADIAQRAFHLLSRPHADGEQVTLKPAPAANALLREATVRTSAPMLFLYSDCRTFLLAICKLGEEGRKYVRRLFLALLADGHPQAQWPPPRLLSLSDLELAAMVWHMQIAEMRRSLPHLNSGRMASLDCDAFLFAPAETLQRMSHFFSLGLGGDYVHGVVAGPLFRRNAKTGEEPFNARRRSEDHARIERHMPGEVDRIVAQSYAICRDTPRALPLPQPLLPIDKDYCR